MKRALLRWLAAWVCSASILGQSTVLFETHFERSEGYNPDLDLAQHPGWLGEGTGGNGLVEFFGDGGQQAYLGFNPPLAEEDFTSVWRPIIFNPVPPDATIVRFAVTFQIVQSTAGGDDDFRWSVYNQAGDWLFSLDFETSTQVISYVLQDQVFQSTGYTFDFDGIYDLVIWMDLARNQWTALLNDVVIANALPMTLNNTELNLGDVDAVWYIRNPVGVGNNFMVFDDYRITSETAVFIPAYLEEPHINAEGVLAFVGHAQRGLTYSVDVTSDFREWFSLVEFVNEDGSFTFEDPDWNQYASGFYRLRLVE